MAAVRKKEWDADRFRDANVELFTRDAELRTRYAEITGTRMVEFRGEEMTMQRCRAHFEDRDRETRREAYEALALARLKDGPEIEDLFDPVAV